MEAVDTKDRKEPQLTLPTKVSVFEPHHRITILYPSFTLKRPGETVCDIVPPNAKLRYEPFPIVPVKSVINNKTNGNEAVGTDFTIFLPVTNTGTQQSKLKGELDDDLQQITASVGHTKIRLILVAKQIPQNDLSLITVRVNRFTKTLDLGGRAHYSKSQHEMPLPELYAAQGVSDHWKRAAIEIINSASDRAVKHKALRGRNYRVLDADIDWKNPRCIEIDDAIPKIAKIMSKVELEHFNGELPDDKRIVQCRVCLDDFGDPDTDLPVKLPCSKKHIVCRSCLREWCKVGGVTNTKCPWCAIKLGTPEVSECLRPNYLDMKAVYKDDLRYTDYENHERRCADLDQSHARDNTATIEITSSRLFTAWTELVGEQPISQDAFLCPWIVRDPTMVPEYFTVAKALLVFCRATYGRRATVKEVFHECRESIFIALRDKFLAGEMYAYLTAAQKESIEKDVYRVPLRPGFLEWIDCSLNRVLQFQTVRLCQTKEECAQKDSMHKHGDRTFFKEQWYHEQDLE